jgi:hypothetical protein
MQNKREIWTMGTEKMKENNDFDFNISRDDVVDLAFLYSDFHYFNFVVCRG